MLKVCMRSVKLILFAVVEEKNRCPSGPPLRRRQVFCHFEQSSNTHAIVRRARSGRDGVIVAGKEDAIVRWLCPVNLEQDICTLEVHHMTRSGDMSNIGDHVAGETDIAVTRSKRFYTREDVGPNSIVCMRVVRMRLGSDL